jgi:4-hydroxy-2-oxoheptanedioate aldolase
MGLQRNKGKYPMEMTINRFKQALRNEKVQYGLWLGLANAYCAEICAGAGFDWLVIDGEHAPNDIRTILAQLQAVAPYPVHPMVRPVEGTTAIVKQLLDIGAPTLLIPLVESAEQARAMVAATRYPPDGVRGVGTALVRAARWNRISDYLARANDEVCLILQIETQKGLDALDEILKVEGVDGIFIGPADLSANLGYRGQPNHSDVQKIIENTIQKIQAAGRAAGILATDPALADHYKKCGARFIAVGVDTVMLANHSAALAAHYKDDLKQTPATNNGAY